MLTNVVVEAAVVSIEKGGTELALIFDDYIRDYLGFSAGLSLVTSSEVDLVTALRKRPMMIRLDAGRLMSEFIYPLWKHYYGAVSKVMDQFCWGVDYLATPTTYYHRLPSDYLIYQSRLNVVCCPDRCFVPISSVACAQMTVAPATTWWFVKTCPSVE